MNGSRCVGARWTCRRWRERRSRWRWFTSAKRKSRRRNAVLADDVAGHFLQGGSAGSEMRDRGNRPPHCRTGAWSPSTPASDAARPGNAGTSRRGDVCRDRRSPRLRDEQKTFRTSRPRHRDHGNAWGYLNRKHDRPPSYKMIWVGNSRLNIMAQAYESRNRAAAVELRQQLHSDKTCDCREACGLALPLAGRPSRRTAARGETRRKGHAARNPENADAGEEDERRGDPPASREAPSASRGLPLRRANVCGGGLNRRFARIILRSMNKIGDPHLWRKKN